MCTEISFHFKGGCADNHMLPADHMINLLEGIRDLTYLTLAQHDGTVFNERFRPSKLIKTRVSVMCKLAQPGSYCQTLEFHSGENQASLFGSDSEDTCKKIKAFLVNLAQDAQEKVAQAFPNIKMRIKAFESIQKAFPPPNSEFYVTIDNESPICSKIIHANCSAMTAALVKNIIEDYMTVVTGRLIRIDFEQKKLVIQHPVTRKLLDCFYNEDIEPMLLENRRELIQVTGNVVLGDNELPQEISDVVCIQEVDLSPIGFGKISQDGQCIQFKSPISFTPVLDDSQQLFILKEEKLGLDICAYTRSEIIEDVKSEILFLWNEYGLAKDSDLTDNALILKRSLHTMLEVVNE